MKALQKTPEAGRAGSVENDFLRMSAPERIRYVWDLDATIARQEAELKTLEAEQEAEIKTLADRLEKLKTDDVVQETLSKELTDTILRLHEAVDHNAQLVADIRGQQSDTPSSEQTDDLVTMEQMAMLSGLNKDILRNRLSGSEEGDGTAEVPEVHLEAAAPDQATSNVPKDPITLEQAALLVGRKPKTLHNQKDKPEPAIPSKGSTPDVFSYAELRSWLIDHWPGSLQFLPESYDQAKENWERAASARQ